MRAALQGSRTDALAAGGTRPGGRAAATLPRLAPRLLAWFAWYSRRHLRRHFHSLRVSRAGHAPVPAGRPAVLFLNHASWWDPLVILVLKEALLGDRALYAPVDASMLVRYPFFARLGCFGLNREGDGRRGAAQFLRVSEAVLRASDSLLAVTPQGRFADGRERPVVFQPGLGHLAARTEGVWFQALAVEYVFWEERLPEILVRFGEPIRGGDGGARLRAPDEWTSCFERAMECTQDELACEARRRRPGDFRMILGGGAGPGGIYGWWRALGASMRFRPFGRERGDP